MKKIYLLIGTLIMSSLCFCGYTQNDVVMLNTGRMKVLSGGINGVSLHVSGAFRNHTVGTDSVKIVQNGISEIGGSFYQDALTNVFDVSPSTTKSLSSGTIRFVKDYGASGNRFITTQSSLVTDFDRGAYYVAFPNVEISTDDSIVLPGKMGIDALTVKRINSKKGSLVLRSELISNNNYDASLRITGSGQSAALVDAGAVVVEREMSLYRSKTPGLFGFATPFNGTQLSGYYAGNWVRKPESDPITGHTRYVLGNKPSVNNPAFINYDQYVINPTIPLNPAQAYLIMPRPAGFNYQTLKDEHGLVATDDVPGAYDKGKFYFNGQVYNLTAKYNEQLFADDNLYIKNFGATTSTINVLIGNSYTSPISAKLLAKRMTDSNITFSSTMYVFSGGSTSYQPFTITGTGDNIIVTDLNEIPAMSIFMIRVSNKNLANGTFIVDKSLLRHGTLPHNVVMNAPSLKGMTRTASSSSNVTNQVLFRLSPQENKNIYDLAAIGLRPTASIASDSYDIAKVYGPDYSYQLFTLSSSGIKLSANGVPEDIESVNMGLRPAAQTTDYTLTAQYAETLTSEGLWLEDLLTNNVVDLKANGEYNFSSSPGDAEQRFVVYFRKPVITSVESGNILLNTYFINNELIVNNLSQNDINNVITLFDVQGRALLTQQVENTPQTIIQTNLSEGVYFVQLKGSRTATSKVIKITKN